MRAVLSLGMAICVAGCIGVRHLDNSNIVLVRARLSSQDVVGCLDGPPIVDACWRLTLRVQDVLIGPTDQREVSVRRFGATLKPDIEFFVLERRDSAGLSVVGWSYAGNGICLDTDSARDLSQEALQKISYWQSRYPCKLNR